jgi:hypothetical protein
MRQRVSTVDTEWLLQSRWFPLLISALVGLAVFLVADRGLHFVDEWRQVGERLDAAPVDSPTRSAVDSVAPRVPADKVAISTPVFAAQSLLDEVTVGDRMDIVALLPSTAGLRAQSAVIVRGATVLARANASSGVPIVFAVTPEESLVVAHLVQSGIPLTYALWSESGPPPPVEPLDPAEVRARLGIAPATAVPPPSPSPPPADPS